MIHKGACHCGRMQYEVEGDLGKVAECNCSICTQRGYLLWFVPRDKLRTQAPLSELSVYTFNKHVIKHHFCPTCGSGVFGIGKDPKGVETAAINVRCLQDVDLAKLERVPFDGRSL